MDRKTVRRCVRAAIEAGFRQDGQNTPEEWKAFVKEDSPEVMDRTARSGCFGKLDRYQDCIAEGLNTKGARSWCYRTAPRRTGMLSSPIQSLRKGPLTDSSTVLTMS